MIKNQTTFFSLERSIFMLLISLCLQTLWSQVPDLMSYQAVVRNSNNQLVANKTIGMRITILQGTTSGQSPVYVETHLPTSNDNGLVSIEIGRGFIVSGTLASIDWSDGPYFIKTETDPTGGANYSISGTSQLLSVPYALYAKMAGNGTGWLMTGNTAGPNDFIGTTNNQELRFKVVNEKAGLISQPTSNTAFGYQTLNFNSTGKFNTANGAKALYSNTTGNSNVAIGLFALYTNTSGSGNTAIGSSALYLNTTGEKNTASGAGALSNNTTGNWNTASGNASLGYNTTGNYNAANGFEALLNNTAGNFNTASGARSLYNNTSGSSNTAVGYFAMEENTSGYGNTASGIQALGENTTGYYNTAFGYKSHLLNTTGHHNVATGMNSLQRNISGTYNSAFGVEALYTNDTGTYNTAVGYEALSTLSGWSNNNTAIGAQTAITDYSNNSTAIGYNAAVIGSNKIVLGNSSITSIGGYASWSSLSDVRFKKDMKPIINSLEFILKLEPITYKFDMEKLNQFVQKSKDGEGRNRAAWEQQALIDKEAITYSGFSAQQVKEAADAVGYDFSGIHTPQNEFDHYTLAYAEFVVPLVKGMQEQQEMIEAQRIMIEELTERIKFLEDSKR